MAMSVEYTNGCVNCGHSHTYDGPLKPLKPVDTPCWKCGCNDYRPDSNT
jgi:predicted nucleic-acid-binding Zn-ribbon protein